MVVAQANGFGGIDSNMVVFGWPGDAPERVAEMLVRSRQLATLSKSTMVVRGVGSRPPKLAEHSGPPEILVWWKGLESNGDMMLLMAHLLSLAGQWRGAKVTLASITDDPAGASKLEEDLRQLLEVGRIKADVELLVRDPTVSVIDTLHIRSRRSALVFVGLAQVDPGDELAYASQLLELLLELPRVILIRNGGPFRGRLV